MQQNMILSENKIPAPVVMEEAWSKLASKHCVDNSLLRREIALSWERCLSYKIDPVRIINACVVNDYIEQDKKAHKLSFVSDGHVQQLYDAVSGNGYVVILADSNGVIVKVLGDRKIVNFAESLYLIPGANCSEDAIGTNSMGTCAIQKQPLQIVSCEHYCQYYHDWSCSSAPILDGFGNLLGTLDISNIDNKPHPLILHNLVRMTARAIGMAWDFYAVQEDVREKYYYFNVAIDTVPDPLIFLDNKNNISHINKKALKLLGNTSLKYVGRSITSLVPEHEKVTRALSERQAWMHIHFQTAHGLTPVSIFVNPVKNKDFERIGAICSIKENLKDQNNNNSTRYAFDDFVCANKKMRAMLRHAQDISITDVSILIEGESGTGKEILAQAIHNNSARHRKPFVAINCAAIPIELIQSELFGYEEGTFTGAKRGGKAGKFELAHGGTLFLDEIGDMPLAAQANLLRALQEKCITRLGGQTPVPVDVRIIAATNKDLHREIKQSHFRADLFYRLAGECLHVLPLRERIEDIWPILFHILKQKHLPNIDMDALQFTHQVKAIMELYAWPGNVRELENVVLFFSRRLQHNVVTVADLPSELQPQEEISDVVDLKQVEQSTILSTLAKHGHNISASAKALGISRTTLYRKMRRLQPAVG